LRYTDIHVHANGFRPEGFNLDKLSEWMDSNNVDRSIVLQLRRDIPRNEDEHDVFMENFRSYEGRIYRFCVLFASEISSRDEALELLKIHKEEGSIGFGEHYGEDLYIDDPKCMRLYEACSEVEFPVLFHMDNTNNRDDAKLSHLENVLKSNPNCTFIAHGPGWWKHSATGNCERLLQAFSNLYGDISAGSGAKAIGRDREFGKGFLIRNSEKLMFGTDIGPWTLEQGNEPQHFDLLQGLNLPDEVMEKICRKNAEHIFNF
jgi:uncharacterized protein